MKCLADGDVDIALLHSVVHIESVIVSVTVRLKGRHFAAVLIIVQTPRACPRAPLGPATSLHLNPCEPLQTFVIILLSHRAVQTFFFYKEALCDYGKDSGSEAVSLPEHCRSRVAGSVAETFCQLKCHLIRQVKHNFGTKIHFKSFLT